jgi:hypothetical protein
MAADLCASSQNKKILIGMKMQGGKILGREKNEGIFLWLLEQDRQKNRILSRRKSGLNQEALQLNVPQTSQVTWQVNFEKEKQPTLNKKNFLEQAMMQKTPLEEESNQVEKEQEKLNLQIITICKELIIKMKKNNSQKQKEINQLKKVISCLQEELDKLTFTDNIEE